MGKKIHLKKNPETITEKDEIILDDITLGYTIFSFNIYGIL